MIRICPRGQSRVQGVQAGFQCPFRRALTRLYEFGSWAASEHRQSSPRPLHPCGCNQGCTQGGGVSSVSPTLIRRQSRVQGGVQVGVYVSHVRKETHLMSLTWQSGCARAVAIAFPPSARSVFPARLQEPEQGGIRDQNLSPRPEVSLKS